MFSIVVSKDVHNISRIICRKIVKEWYAFALGKLILKKNNVVFQIADIYVPYQEASITHVYIPPEGMMEMFDVYPRIKRKRSDWILLGMWHSHAETRVFHSFIDRENISNIYQTFPKHYLPSASTYEKIFGPEILREMHAEPILGSGLRGFRICFGSLCVEIDLRQEVDDELFFVTWYSHLYTIKALVDVLKEYFGAIPILSSKLRKTVRYVVSVVVNNYADIEGRVFIFDSLRGGAPRESRADVCVEDIKESPIFARRESLEEIISKIRVM